MADNNQVDSMKMASFIDANESAKPRGQTYVLSVHSASVLRNLNDYRLQDGLLCDVTLVAEGREFAVHRAVMAAASEYFRAMFTGDMKEATEPNVELRGMPAIGLEHIIDFAYTSKICLCMDRIRDVLMAATYIQLTPIIDFCSEFLISEINIDNCVDIGHIAHDYHLAKVDKTVDDFILRNFSVLARKEEDFVRITLEKLVFLLARDELLANSELEIFKAAAAWLTHDPDRIVQASKVMEKIRFALIPPDAVIESVQTVDFMRQSVGCTNLLIEASNYHLMQLAQPVLQCDRTRVRSLGPSLVASGGLTKQNKVEVCAEALFFDKTCSNWINMKPLEKTTYTHCVATLGNFLFVVGGQNTLDRVGKSAVASAYRYDPRFNRWLQLSSLREARTYFALCAVRGRLYAIGGENRNGEIASVECYLPNKDEWTYVTQLPMAMFGHAGSVLDQCIYISGGFASGTFSNVLYRYDPALDEWDSRAPMPTTRGFHCMAKVKNRIYVIGGNHFDADEERVDVLTVECYTPETDQWCEVAPLREGQGESGISVLDDKIYLIGGYSLDQNSRIKSVQCYDPEKDVWGNVPDYPEAIAGVACCTLDLPSNLKKTYM
ncbi:KLHL9 [Branchiostoma lanceolatum]|uniref:KLHL9 protein n=1 Tax=Branchiostoma lanceolatum TaxID=7740 RepID=A0A8J9YN17_BRALA|nr:KLHL9 [Branchiostoma lanceolatum]